VSKISLSRTKRETGITKKDLFGAALSDMSKIGQGLLNRRPYDLAQLALHQRFVDLYDCILWALVVHSIKPDEDASVLSAYVRKKVYVILSGNVGPGFQLVHLLHERGDIVGFVSARINRWHNLLREPKIRYCRKAENYEALVCFANAIICFRMARLWN
jgi:hypothetical protein